MLHNKTYITVYKALHGLAPQYIANLLSSNKPERHLRSSERSLLQENRTNLSTAGDRAFVNYAPRACNKLPEAVKLSSNVAVFKRNLETTLFKFAY